MHTASTDQNVGISSSSPGSSHLSVTGPSTSPSPISQTPALIIVSLKEIVTETVNLIECWPKKTSTAQALAELLRGFIPPSETLINNLGYPDEAAITRLQELHCTLGEVRHAVKAKTNPRKRHILKGAANKVFGTKEQDVFTSCRVRVMEALYALELQPSPPKSTASTGSPHSSAGGTIIPPTPCPDGKDHPKTTLDAVEKLLQVSSGFGDVIPAPAGSIFKVIGAVGLSIIKMLNDVINNNEEAKGLVIHVDDLVQTIARFLQNNGKQIGDDTVTKLKAFETTLKSVNTQLENFKAQGGIQKGVSHARNKEVLTGCDTQIRRSFTQLQVHLSLDAVRLLTDLGDADAQRKRRDLLDRLGDADTGATDKVNDPADLMCLEGTRVDLLDEVDNWASNNSSKRVLWINGVAGCGKSAIAATVASRREGQSATAVFHFARANQPRNKHVICSIARQLAKKITRGSDGSPEHLVLSCVQADPDIASAHLSTQFHHLLLEPLTKVMPGSPPILIVIDALDEWDNRDGATKLVDLIRKEHDKLPPSIKFLFTSRKESHLDEAFGSDRVRPLVKSLALDDTPRQTVERDIHTYLTKNFKDIRSTSLALSAAGWPGPASIGKLVTLSGGLFQWASTVVQHVKGGRSHDIRLKDIFASPNQLKDLDTLYKYILDTFLQTNTRPSAPTFLQYVLGSIVVAPTPISLDTLVYLHADSHEKIDDTTSEIQEILAALGALLIVPAQSNEAIRVLHPSIIDFLTDQLRCMDKRLHVDLALQNRRVALLCLHRMLRDLKRDICAVGDPTKLNADPEVLELVSKSISNPMRYACRYWAQHLSASQVADCVEVGGPLRRFCTGYLLFWFEVMGLTCMVQHAIAGIKSVEHWITQCPPDIIDSTVPALLYDARRFLLICFEPVSINAAHIYLSTLSTIPSETEFGRTYQTSTSTGPRTLTGPISKYWPGSLWVARRNPSPVASLAFSPDDTIIASGFHDGTLILENAETGEQEGPMLQGHSGCVDCVAFSFNSKFLASGSSDHTVRLWDVATRVQGVPTMKGHSDTVFCLAFSPDDTSLVSGSEDGTLRMWNTETGAQIGVELKGHTDSVFCVVFSPDGKIVASGSRDKTVRLWDAESGTQKGPKFKGHTSSVYRLAFLSKGRSLVSASQDKTMRLWDVATGTQKGSTMRGHTAAIFCMVVSPDGSLIASGSYDKTLRLWDAERGVQMGPTLEGHTGSVNCLAFSFDGKTLASGSSDKTMRLWDVDTRMQTGATLEGHTGAVDHLAFSSDGMSLASGSQDSTVRLWDVRTEMRKGSPLKGHTDTVESVVFSPDGKTLVSCSDDHTVCLWDAEKGHQRGRLLKGHSDEVSCVAFSPDGKVVASGSNDRILRLWDAESGAPTETLRGHTGSVYCLIFSPSGEILASGSEDNTIRLWDMKVGVWKETLEGHTGYVDCLAFSSNGEILASGSYDASVRLWDVEIGVQKGPTLEGNDYPISCLAFSSDGRNLAAGSRDATVSLWDTETGTQMLALKLLSSPLRLEFSLSGRTLATFDSVDGISEWDFESETFLSPSSSDQRAPDSDRAFQNGIILIDGDGWVRYGNTVWFWLPAAFGRALLGELRGSRLVFCHDRHVCIVDVSEIMYLID